MAKGKMLQIRVSEEQLEGLKDRASKAGLSVSAYLLQRGLDEEPAVTTAAKLPAPKRKAKAKLCRSCQKAGVAAWNCRECSPLTAGTGVGR